MKLVSCTSSLPSNHHYIEKSSRSIQSNECTPYICWQWYSFSICRFGASLQITKWFGKILSNGSVRWTQWMSAKVWVTFNSQTDHIPDSSGHIPYRVGRPSGGSQPLPQTVSPQSPLPAAILTDYDSIPYHLSNYAETEKWHKWDLEYGKNSLPYNSTRVQRNFLYKIIGIVIELFSK